MPFNNSRLISDVSLIKLHTVLSNTPPDSLEIIKSVCTYIFNKDLTFRKNSCFPSILSEIKKIYLNRTVNLSLENKYRFNYALVANLALNSLNLIDKLDLSVSIYQLYPSAFERLANFLERFELENYDISSDFFKKDISFTLGHTVPCGPLSLELLFYFKTRSVIRSILRGSNTIATIKYIKSFGTGPWFTIHLDTRYLDEFNEEGYDRCYHFIAEMLLKRPSIRGLVGTTWLYDPRLTEISPHLSFLLKPLDYGAFLMKHGSPQIDIERATLKSKKRRRLYEEGRYLPVCYSLFWPRKYLLTWASPN